MSSPGYNSEGNNNINVTGNSSMSYSGAAASSVNTAIQAGSGLWSSWKNRKATERMNEENWRRQQEINALNRQYALEDWERTSSYNSPAQQMKRLKEAGLNPNLIYGKFDGGNMQMPKTPSAQIDKAQKVDYENPLAGVDALGNYYAVRTSEMQLAMMEQQIKGQKLENQKKSLLNSVLAVDTPILLTEGEDRRIERINKRSILNDESIIKDLLSQKLGIELEVKQAMFDSNAHFIDYWKKQIELEQSELKRQQMLEALEVIKNDKQRKQLEVQLYEMGMQPNDPFYYRVMMRLAKKMFID